MGHKIASSSIREKHATYKQALTRIKKSMENSKGLLPHVGVESVKVISEDVGQESAQRYLGNSVEKIQVIRRRWLANIRDKNPMGDGV